METKEAENYPLVTDYDFSKVLGPQGGSGKLLIPAGGNQYKIVEFGFSCLRLLPYFQEIFKGTDKISVGGLEKIINNNGELELTQRPLVSEDSWFFETIIIKLVRNDILNHERVEGQWNALRSEDMLSKGPNYDKVRVLSMDSAEKHVMTNY